jgi:hypothetical protein
MCKSIYTLGIDAIISIDASPCHKQANLIVNDAGDGPMAEECYTRNKRVEVAHTRGSIFPSNQSFYYF